MMDDKTGNLHFAKDPPELVGCAAGRDTAEDQLGPEASVGEEGVVDVVGGEETYTPA